jgi:glutamate-ammonia-ligase adenylyltransferase
MSLPNPETNHTLVNSGVARSLVPVGFSDPSAAQACFERIARLFEADETFAQIMPTLLLALSEAAHPDRVLVSLERFVRNVPDRQGLLAHLEDNPRALELLVTLLAGSQFLTEILLRTPEYFTPLTDQQILLRQKETDEFFAEAQAAIEPHVDLESSGFLSPAAVGKALNALRRFQRWELLQLGANDLLGLMDVSTVTKQLSNLADSLIRICLKLAARQARKKEAGFAVLGMGKLGGRELNYSSDIDLLFVSESNGAAYQPLGQRLIENLIKATAEGFLYRVDMRLRPWGRTGPLVTSLDAYLRYLGQHAQQWEKQALLKARALAGDSELGSRFLSQVESFIFEAPADTIRADVRTMKARIEEELHKTGRHWGEVKLGAGSIRDVEFVTQYLQLVHGQDRPRLHSPNTLDALARLTRARILSPDERRILATGYTFLRSVEHILQMMHYQQTHTLPDDPVDLDHLARRLGFQGPEAGAAFVIRYQQHTAAIRAVYRRHIEQDEDTPEEQSAEDMVLAGHHLVARHLARLSNSYAEIFTPADITRHTELLARLSEDNLVEVEALALENGLWQVTVVGYDYLGELSLICGLMYVYRLNIISGHVFTYQAMAGPTGQPDTTDWPRIVDVFWVRPETPEPPAASFWAGYGEDLEQFVGQLHRNEYATAQHDLINRFATALSSRNESAAPTLYPINIRIDNESDDRYTILHIDTPDTIGFLYEFANALALNNINIARVSIETVGNRAQDVLYVTNPQGNKITSGQKLFELRAATVLVKHFTHLLPQAPNPAAALTHFREFLGQLFTRPDWPAELATLIRPEVLDALARLLGVSDFLWDDFLRMQHSNLFPVIRDVEALARNKPITRLKIELEAILEFAPDRAEKRRLLNEFKDREMFRIDMRHILGHTVEQGQFGGELSDLAEVVLSAGCDLCYQALRHKHGDPYREDGQPCRMAVCALGKFGGRELGFASDIELMFVYDHPGQTAGPEVVTGSAFYEKLVQDFQQAIQAKREGIFELDMRLRPYGKAGRMAVPLDSFQRYFAAAGPSWDYERQALVKLRPIAGDAEFGRELVALRDALIYTDKPFDVATMRGMRERQLRHLVTPGTINAKFSPGGLVDIEYLVQGLQISYGHAYPALRVTNTREALQALSETDLISNADCEALSEAYNFLRRLINALRMVRGNAKDLTIPPTGSEEFAFLTRRLDYGPGQDQADDFAQLRKDLTAHTSAVLEINSRLLAELG